MITDRQLAMIRTKIIWMTGRPQPNQAFVDWWQKRDRARMEKQAEGLTTKQAYQLIRATINGNWDREGGVIQLWSFYAKSMQVKQMHA